ncbi:RICIN domain-containing protein [Streptomyces sp. NPDC059816]|uniref:RICIN domain-containing protein n=1 Tax=Streptomyces sp. NPDC059816 TaxID=3346960 RepID=UPI003657AD45
MSDGERRVDGPARELGCALRALQQRSGRTLRSLESEVSISDSSLSRYLRGSTVPPWSTVRELCRALGADPAPYRTLWEAADRCQPKPLADAVPAAPAERQGTVRRLRAATARPRGRWLWAGSGALAGVLLGAALTALVVPPTGSVDGAEQAARPAPRVADAGRLFVNRASGACLDDSADEGLRSFTCNALPYQRWTVRASADGTSQLRNHATGDCVGHHQQGLRSGPCGPSAAQRWRLTVLDDGAAAELRNEATGRCLHDGGQGLHARSCDHGADQKWA